MKKGKKLLIMMLMVISGLVLHAQEKLTVLSAPAGNEPVKINPDGATVIPNGRLVTPAGKLIQTAPHPYGLILSHDGNTAVTANSGVGPISVTIIHDLKSSHPRVQQIPPGVNTDKGILASVFMGLAVSPDDSLLYVAGGQENVVYTFNLSTGEKTGVIPCREGLDGGIYEDGYIGDMVLNKDGSVLYAVDQIQFRLLVIDTRYRQLIRSIPVGRYPFGIALSPDEKKYL